MAGTVKNRKENNKITHAKQVNLKECSGVLVLAPEKPEDFLLATPAVSALKESMPNRSEITAIVSSNTGPISLHSSCISKTIIYNPMNPWKALAAIIFGKYDLIIDFREGGAAAVLAGLLGKAKGKIAYAGPNGILNSLYPIKLHTIGHPQHKIVKYLNLVRFIGANSYDFTPKLVIPHKDKAYALEFMKKHEIAAKDILVGIHPTCKSETKRWSLNKWEQLVNNLIDKYGAKVIVFSHGDEKDRLKEFLHVTGNRCVVFDSRDMMKRAAISRFLCAFVCNEDDLMHLFAAFTNIIVIWGDSDPEINKPTGYNHQIMKAADGHADSVPVSRVTEQIKKFVK